MGKVLEQIINRFDKGMHNDPRIGDYSYAQVIKGFDAHTYPRKLVPLRDSESGDSAASTSRKQNFCVALRTGTTHSLYSLGVISGDTKAEILYKNLTQSSDTDLSDATWTNTANNQGTTASTFTWFELFVYYRKTGLIYSARGTSATAGTHICTYDPAGSAAFSDTHQALTYTSIRQGLVHSKDDILYIPYYDNAGAAGAKSFIAKNNNGSWTTNALTLPDHLIPNSICEYGNYLAIGCVPASGIGKSVIYLWDRDATLATLSESIDWGEGNLKVLEEVEGHLIGVSSMGIDAATGASNQLYGELVIRTYSGGTANILKRFISTGNSVNLTIAKQNVNHFLYFLCGNVGINGTGADNGYHGLWKIGRITSDAPFALTFDRPPSNADSVANVGLKNFFVVGDYVFISYTDSSVFKLTKTSESSTGFGSTICKYESLIFGDSRQNKKLVSAWVNHEALGSSGSVILKYKLNAETSYTTILTNTTANSFYKEAVNIESSGDNLPIFREISFQILNTTGTPITGFGFRYEIIDDGVVS